MADKSFPTNAEQALLEHLSAISEERWSAGWLTDWEHRAWEAFLGRPVSGHDAFSEQDYRIVPWLVLSTRTWPVGDDVVSRGRWDRDKGLRMVPLKKWREIHAVWMAARKKGR
jgi:hypothetical protein